MLRESKSLASNTHPTCCCPLEVAGRGIRTEEGQENEHLAMSE